jgi:hypothetical protein
MTLLIALTLGPGLVLALTALRHGSDDSWMRPEPKPQMRRTRPPGGAGLGYRSDDDRARARYLRDRLSAEVDDMMRRDAR